jgi:branched-chain amino acid transport system permease protein
MTATEIFIQQLVIGLSNGVIIALIALGYTMVYGLIELINFAHGDLFMLGGFLALTIIGALGYSLGGDNSVTTLTLMLIAAPFFCGTLNVVIERFAYRPLRDAPRLVPLVSALGISFILMNIGLFWGGLPMEVFGFGQSAAAPKDFPSLFSGETYFPESSIQFGSKDLFVFAITIPCLIGLLLLVLRTQFGRAMRAVAQNPVAARLVGIDVDSVITKTFFLGGALAGLASVVYASYNNTISFQMGYRVGTDAFTAAVLGGIGNLMGAVVGGLVIGVLRAVSDQYLATQWTNTVVFGVLIVLLVFCPRGLLGKVRAEKV